MEPKIVLAWGYFIATVLCAIALGLPIWTVAESAQPEVCRPVVLTKTSGLLWSYEYLQVKQEILPKDDAAWQRTTGHGIKPVIAMMCIGLSFLILRFVIITGYLCCCCCNNKDERASAYSCWMGFLSFVCIGVAVLVFYLDVKTDDENLLAGFWIALGSTSLAFITGFADIVVSIYMFRKTK